MNTEGIVEQLRERGLELPEAESRAALLDRAATSLSATTGAAPAWAWVVPGRIEVIGKHTDYAGGRSLVAAAPRGFVAVASPRPDNRVVVLDARWQQRAEIDLSADTSRRHGWASYVAVTAHRLAANFPGATLGTSIAVASDLPRAAGLSSSSVLVVSVALALVRRGGLDNRPEWAQSIRNRLDLAGYLGAIESGTGFGPLTGARGVGTHGGSEDHTAILNGQAGRVSAFRYVPVAHLADARMSDRWRFVVMTSGIRADKAGTVRERYNRASQAARALCEVYEAQTGLRFPTLSALLDSSEEAAPALRRQLHAGNYQNFSGGELQRRLDHFDAENRRVVEAVAAFDRADDNALGVIASASQSDASVLLGNQIPETNRLVDSARDAGAFAATSFGAGFGGSVWALAHASEADRVAERWRRTYLAASPAIRDVEWFIGTPAPGAFELLTT